MFNFLNPIHIFPVLFIKRFSFVPVFKPIGRFIFISLLWILFSVSGNATEVYVQLYANNFDDYSYHINQSCFVLNSNEIGTLYGKSLWAVNDVYEAINLAYDDTPYQPNVLGLDSKYLHIYPGGKNTGQNAAYNDSLASQSFVYFGEGFCTSNLHGITLTLYHTGGNENAYAEIYYSANFGEWQKYEGIKLYGNEEWKFEKIKLDDLSNYINVRIGFGWKNESGTGKTQGIGIDDVEIYGYLNKDTEFQVSVLQDTICENNSLLFNYKIMDEVCYPFFFYLYLLDGDKENFIEKKENIYGKEGTLAMSIPSYYSTSGCKQLKARYVNHPDFETSISDCFFYKPCDSICKLYQPKLIFQDTLMKKNNIPSICTESYFPVYFTKYGPEKGEPLTIKLSNKSGNFDYSTYTIGKKQINHSLGSKIDSVWCKIPLINTNSCNYYIQANFGEDIKSEIIGPFCIETCDMTINNNEVLELCINEKEPTLIDIPLKLNTWNNQAVYGDEDTYLIEMRTIDTFELLEIYDWNFNVDIMAGNLQIEIPAYEELIEKYNIEDNNYLFRFRTDDFYLNDESKKISPWLQFCFGLSDGIDYTIEISDNDCNYCVGDIFCLDGIANIEDKGDVSYELYVNNNLYGRYAYSDMFKYCVPLENIQSYDLQLLARNQGCVLAKSNILSINSSPEVSFFLNISGPKKLCRNGVYTYTATEYKQTNYSWKIEGAEILEQDNNKLTIQMDEDAVGLKMYLTLNSKCGNWLFEESLFFVAHEPIPTYSESPNDTVICKGTSVEVSVKTDAEHIAWKQGELVLQVNKKDIYIQPETTTHYTVDLYNSNNFCVVTIPFTVIVKECTDIIINQNEDAGNIKLYPNPVKDGKIIVDLGEQQSDHYTLNLYDVYGKLIMSEKLLPATNGQKTLMLELPDFKEGIYFWQVVNNDKAQDILNKGKLIVLKK